MSAVRVESSVTSVSWIPLAAVSGPYRLPFELGIAHYDEPPPSVLGSLDEWAREGRFRLANRLRAWIEVEGDRIVAFGQDGRGHVSDTVLRLATRHLAIAPTPLPTLRPQPEVGEGWVRFTQTAGGRTGAPAPRPVRRPPYVQVAAPTAWTTLALTLYADGRAEGRLVGASPFPRHWVYDDRGGLVAKSGLMDYRTWSAACFGIHSPWGHEDSPILVTAVETALERRLSHALLDGTAPSLRTLRPGQTLVEQGAPGSDLYLLLDGLLLVEVDGKPVTELGPGAVVGELAALDHAPRNATLRAVTRARVAVAAADRLDPAALEQLAQARRR